MRRYLWLLLPLCLSVSAPLWAVSTSQNIAVTVTSQGGQTVSVITLTNGPPNLSAATIPAGMPSGSPVSDVYADNAGNTPFTGTFSQPTGANASSFSISTIANCGSAGNITCGKLVTNGVLAAGTYNITLATSQGGSQRVTIYAVAGTIVSCGSSTTVQNAANAAGNGATLLFPACTYNWTAGVSAPTNQTWVGVPGQTIFDAGGNEVSGGNCGNAIMVCGIGAGTTGVTLANLTFQNHGSNLSNPVSCFPGGNMTYPDCPHRNWMVQTNNGWTVKNNIFKNSVWQAVTSQFVDGASINFINNVIQHMGANGIGTGQTGAATFNVIGNDISDINYTPILTCDGSGNKWLGDNFTLNWKFNYVHDNLATSGFWEDSYSNMTMLFQGNTWVRNGWGAIQLEVANGTTTIDSNVFIDNGNSQLSVPSVQCGLTSTPDIWVHGSPNVTVTNNNFTQDSSGLSYPGLTLGISDDDCRVPVGQDPSVVNINAHDNTVTFRGQAGSNTHGGVTWGSFQACNPKYPTSSNASNNNHFHVPRGNTSDPHFSWMNGSNWEQPVLSFTGFQSTYGQESTSTIDTTDAGANGCLHVACAVNPVGSGGTQQVTAAIQNITLSNNMFTPNVANGAVGTVSVTMSDGSAFSGTLSITGTNSGGFHLSGNILQEKASGGTPAGAYHDFNIVATEANVSNSPQQISPP
jgi:hypothetical protein